MGNQSINTTGFLPMDLVFYYGTYKKLFSIEKKLFTGLVCQIFDKKFVFYADKNGVNIHSLESIADSIILTKRNIAYSNYTFLNIGQSMLIEDWHGTMLSKHTNRMLALFGVAGYNVNPEYSALIMGLSGCSMNAPSNVDIDFLSMVKSGFYEVNKNEKE